MDEPWLRARWCMGFHSPDEKHQAEPLSYLEAAKKLPAVSRAPHWKGVCCRGRATGLLDSHFSPR